jgi:hypothetical protein
MSLRPCLIIHHTRHRAAPYGAALWLVAGLPAAAGALVGAALPAALVVLALAITAAVVVLPTVRVAAGLVVVVLLLPFAAAHVALQWDVLVRYGELT